MSREERARLRRRRFQSIKKRKFKRFESWRYIRVKESWRKPRGLDSKVHLKLKGVLKMPSIGHRMLRSIRGLHPSGYKEILVYSPLDLERIDPAIEAIKIAHTVGKRKRLEILEKAKERNIFVLNP